jgi:glycosyltransferase involved in cell wall biosynthesis
MTDSTDRPLRILSMADVPEDPNAGASGAEYETIAALRRHGHEVDDVWRDEMSHRIKHGNLHLAIELPREYERIVRERLSRSEYDVVHVNQPHGYRAAKLVRRHWPKTAFIHRSHGWEPHVREVLAHWRRIYGRDERTALRRAASTLLEPFVARHADAIVRWADGHILCSAQDAEYMQRRNRADPSALGVMPQAPPEAYNAAAALPFDATRLTTFLHVSQFAFFKAPMITADAMNRIARERPDVRFVWVSGREHHDSIARLLSEETRPRLQLLGWMSQRELRDVYDRAGVFLFPSFFEGSGKVHIEAMSRGLCVVASSVGGMRDYIQDGTSGVLVPPGDAEAFAREALALAGNLDRARSISQAAARRAREYSWDRTAVETAAFYRACIARKRQALASYPLPR